MIEFIALALGFLLVAAIIGGILFPKRVGHDILGWPKLKEVTRHDGMSRHGTCKYCNKDIIETSQGWLH